ncbi:hypothetical protein BGZ94_005226, partial [Podila epigama]
MPRLNNVKRAPKTAAKSTASEPKLAKDDAVKTNKKRKSRGTKRTREVARKDKIVAESPEFQEMFERLHAMGLLKAANACRERHGKPKSIGQEWLQSACVALSCTLDLAGPKVALTFFTPEYLKLAEEACAVVWPVPLPPAKVDLTAFAKRYDDCGGDLTRMKAALVLKGADLGDAGDSPQEEKE